MSNVEDRDSTRRFVALADKEMPVTEHDQEKPEPTTSAALRKAHASRTESAAARAAALSRYVEQHGSDDHADAVWKAAYAARVAAQSLAVLSESEPDPAVDSRCSRNAAAAAAQASLSGQLVDRNAEASGAACRAALRASQAAAAAAGGKHLGAAEELNAEADNAEKEAVAAAERAGWIKPGESVPAVSPGVRSADVMAMLHF